MEEAFKKLNRFKKKEKKPKERSFLRYQIPPVPERPPNSQPIKSPDFGHPPPYHSLRSPNSAVESIYIQPATIPNQNASHVEEIDGKEHVYETLLDEALYFQPEESTENIDRSIVCELGAPPSPSSVLKYPCMHPVNPKKRKLEARLETFSGKTDWPAHRLVTPIQEFAIAGWFYLGEKDQTACWYCNGLLNNWGDDDIPWEEHARWYPKCEHVLRCKGSEYVAEIQRKYSPEKEEVRYVERE